MKLHIITQSKPLKSGMNTECEEFFENLLGNVGSGVLASLTLGRQCAINLHHMFLERCRVLGVKSHPLKYILKSWTVCRRQAATGQCNGAAGPGPGPGKFSSNPCHESCFSGAGHLNPGRARTAAGRARAPRSWCDWVIAAKLAEHQAAAEPAWQSRLRLRL